jgi:hypothetical protein
MNLPYLALNQIVLDAELVRRLPRKLAYYHLALPLAADDDQISVAMAYPDNRLVIDLLTGVLAAPIVPVQASPAEIRAALDHIWQFVKEPVPHWLSWGDNLFTANRAHNVALPLSRLFSAKMTDLRDNDLTTVIGFTQQDKYHFTVVSDAPHDTMADLVRGAATPLLLLFGDFNLPFKRVLLSLRGHSPDLSALDWLIPLATDAQAETTVLAVTAAPQPGQRRPVHSLAVLLDPENDAAQHLTDCTERLFEAGIRGYTKYCQGDPVEQIAAEFQKGRYDLLVIISEAHGDFVQAVLAAVENHEAPHAVLVVKPTLLG